MLRNKQTEKQTKNLLRLIRKLQIVLTLGGLLGIIGAIVAGANTVHRARLDTTQQEFYEVLTSIHQRSLYLTVFPHNLSGGFSSRWGEFHR